jgi:orotate phosphoribosyltransferase
VITAGTAIRESIDIIKAAGAAPSGVLLALDRQERAPGSDFSAVQEVRSQYQIPVVAVINLADLMQHVSKVGQAADLSSMRLYRERYGLAD